mmetsp:Transcript_535/g.476  ORF Transcript_535/g.476 Transcript_535/m.476 type:complete len:192 (+) Transcript_535:376-951(+)
MWSIGCIIGEIFQLTSFETSHSFKRKTTVLFPGKIISSLPTHKDASQFKDGFQLDKSDQLYSIFQMLGSPSNTDLEFTSNKILKNYIRSFPKKVNNLKDLFPHIEDGEAINFLEGLLVFGPNKRMTIKKALNHSFFEEFFDGESEDSETDLSGSITLEFEDDLDKKLTERKLRKYFSNVFKSTKYTEGYSL